MSWLDEVLRQHEDFESPMSFWRWGAISAIAAVMKDSVYMDRYLYKLYPNIYVIFHADSGLKKGPPINMAYKLVKMVNNTTIIKGRSSVQAILKEMGTAHTQPGGRIQSDGSVYINSSEMSSSLVEDPAAAKILTDLFDRHYNEDDWKSLLKQEVFNLKNPTVNMLAGTNEAMAEDFTTNAVIKGGFLARSFIIYEAKRNKRNSLAFQPEHIPDYTNTAEYLKELAKLKGPFRYFSSPCKDDYFTIPIKVDSRTAYFSEAGAIYHRWYDDFLDTVDSQEVKDETGTLNRFGDSVVKVAMLLSLAEQPKLEISPTAVSEAIRICEQLLGNVRRTTAGKNGLSTSSNLKALIVNELLITRENHIISRQMLSKKFNLHYSAIEELDHVMESFHIAGMILTKTTKDGVIYEMPEVQVKQLTEYLAGKGNRREK